MNTKQKIFETAIKLFSEKGYKGTSIREIVIKVGIKESSLYNHFSSKKEILNEIFRFYEIEFFSALPTKNEMEETANKHTDPVKLWIEGITQYWKKTSIFIEDINKILLNEMFINNECSEFALEKMFVIQKKATKMMLTDLYKKRMIKKCNFDLVSTQYVYMLHGMGLENRLKQLSGEKIEQIQKNSVRVIAAFIENLKEEKE